MNSNIIPIPVLCMNKENIVSLKQNIYMTEFLSNVDAKWDKSET